MLTVAQMEVLMKDYDSAEALRAAVVAEFSQDAYVGFWQFLRDVEKDAKGCVLRGTMTYGAEVRFRVGEDELRLSWGSRGLRVTARTGVIPRGTRPEEAIRMIVVVPKGVAA